jgi:diguanylate cyclase (GGDEF)-like protein
VIPEFGAAGRVETLMLIGRDVTERKQAEEHVRYISFHDAVTGLYNRAYFEAEIRRLDTLRSLPISIIIGDVNHLKLTNDTFGHREGDRLLASIGEILQSCCRDEDIIARWGGDEFAVILPKTSAETAAEICGRIHKSAEAYGDKLAIRPSIALGSAVKRSPEEDIFAVVSEAEEEMYDDKLAQSKKNRDAVIGSLLERVRRTWPEHEAHLSRSCDIADRFAAALGLSERELADLKLVILLHDIGKAAVPDTCLKKPGRLTVEEWEAVKRYPETGFRIAKSFAETARVSDEVLSLRERWDGTGYPRGLKGEEIPHLSRVFSIVDVYDILTHERPYAAALTHEQAVGEIRKHAGKQFDPRLVEAFTRSVAAGE